MVAVRDALAGRDRELFDRIYHLTSGTGRLSIPEPMLPWVNETYGGTKQVAEQQVVKITNLWTLQTSLFNPFRAQRPQKDDEPERLADEIYGDGPDPFDEPEENTSEDTFGRIRGEHCITAGNLAKSDVSHGVIIFNEHNPWMVTEDAFADAIDVAVRWFDASFQHQPDANYPLLIWNCLWKAGASIDHAHMQLLMTGSMHYGEIERLRRTAERYRQEYGSGYVDDLYQVHDTLGLGRDVPGGRAFAHLTPLLANEVVLFANELSDDFARSIHRVIRMLNEKRDVVAFNMVLIPRPLGSPDEDWSVMPVMVRIVDRGNPVRKTVDTAAVELFAGSVISTDPFDLARDLADVDFS